MANALKSAASTASSTLSSGAQQAQQAATSATNSASSAVQGAGEGSESEGSQKWNAMTEEQKKAAFDNLPEEQKQGKSYYEWLKEGYQHQKENWMPWIEDQYLKWFTKDNRASYGAKDTLSKTKVTGVDQVDNAQDGVNNLVGDQIGRGGALEPVGDVASRGLKEGMS